MDDDRGGKNLKAGIRLRALAAPRSFTIALLTAVVLMLALAGAASAVVTPTINVSLSDNQLGAHADTTVKIDFFYGNTDLALYPPESPINESVKHTVVDIPPGLVGNPNAVPFADRCDPTVFETGDCPASSTVGTFVVNSTLIGSEQDVIDYPPQPGDSYVNMAISGVNTRLSLLKTDPDAPATFGIWIRLPFNFGIIRQKIRIGPDTDSDLKLRTVTIDPITRKFILGAGVPGDPFIDYQIRVNSMTLKFLGKLANGNNFMTNPTSCTKWESKVWASAHQNNSNATEDPLGTGDLYVPDSAPSITPDCTNQASVPFPVTGVTTISSRSRDVSPDFDFTITNPGVQANGQVSTSPKSVVTRVPASINVDTQQLGRLCENEPFAKDQCPASSRVGTVSIETPLISAGLQGDVYLVRAAGRVLPDLGLRMRGAISFTQKGKNVYVGENNNMIQTTFDDIPQVGFSKLNVHLFGGPEGLLRTLACPTNNRQPDDGVFSYTFTSYTNQVVTSTTDLTAANCFGIQKLRSFKCVYRLLRFQPTYTSRARIRTVKLTIDGKRAAVARRAPFQFRVGVKKYKLGKHKLKLRAVYDDGTVSEKKSTFKRCGR